MGYGMARRLNEDFPVIEVEDKRNLEYPNR